MGRTIVNDGRTWEIEGGWPYLFPHGTPGVDLLATAAYEGEGYKTKLFRMNSYNVAGLPDPDGGTGFTTLDVIPFFTVIDGGTAEPVNKPPVFLDNASVPISNYAKHRIMRSGPEAEGTALAFTLPTDAEGWIEFSVDHAWETDALGKLKTPLVLVASGSDLISTNGGK